MALRETSPLWVPSHPNRTPISVYRQHVNEKFELSLENSQELHQWSVDKYHDFWIDLWDYVGMTPSLPLDITKAFDDSIPFSEIPKFFEGVNINYAENILMGRDPTALALIGLREGQPLSGDPWTWGRLIEAVRKLRSSLLDLGIQQEDIVAALMSNSPWTLALSLAVASIGAVFTSISPEMGAAGCISRLEQVQPAVLFADSHQTYKGKQRSIQSKVEEIVEALPRTPKVVILPLDKTRCRHETLPEFLTRSRPGDRLKFVRVPFSSPLMVVYSSGTTGAPKCMVHAHGVILNMKKISMLHNSLTSRDVVLQYTSTSWVMFNILQGHLACGATVILYDGSPMYPQVSQLLSIAAHHKATWIGTSPRYLLELETTGTDISAFDLSSLRMLTTTGAPLAPSQFEWFYSVFPPTIHLSSVAGGTEICTSWLASNPAGPVYAGEMQMPALGHDVDIVSDTDRGLVSLKATGEAGEFVCRRAFPSMPVRFWGSEGAAQYRASYFERFEGSSDEVWAQHDWAVHNPTTSGWQILGRSDGVLNPSGVRFGSGEIYAVLETRAFQGDVADTLCVGRRREGRDVDETVFLFVKMKDSCVLTYQLKRQIESTIRQELSARHVPRFIEQVADIPVTINGKKVEIAVKKIISGMNVKVSATVANPECLDEYVKFRDYEEQKVSRLARL